MMKYNTFRKTCKTCTEELCTNKQGIFMKKIVSLSKVHHHLEA